MVRASATLVARAGPSRTVTVMTVTVLLPQTKYGDGPRRRRRYEGSSLVAEDGMLRWTPAPGASPGRWQLTLGCARGQAATLVHVHSAALVPSRFDASVDWYVLVDAAGTVLAHFPESTDVPYRTGSDPWFTQAAVAAFAAGAGLGFKDVYVESPKELEAQFPGLYPHLSALVVMSYVTALTYVAIGVGLLGLGVSIWAGGGFRPAGSLAATVAVGAVMFLLGLLLAAVGVGACPPVAARYLARAKRLHPERFSAIRGGTRVPTRWQP
jgi:hypothetical protein